MYVGFRLSRNAAVSGVLLLDLLAGHRVGAELREQLQLHR